MSAKVEVFMMNQSICATTNFAVMSSRLFLLQISVKILHPKRLSHLTC